MSSRDKSRKNNAALRMEGGTMSVRVDPALSFIPIRRDPRRRGFSPITC
jgi:hypothetical protein